MARSHQRQIMGKVSDNVAALNLRGPGVGVGLIRENQTQGISGDRPCGITVTAMGNCNL